LLALASTPFSAQFHRQWWLTAYPGKLTRRLYFELKLFKTVFYVGQSFQQRSLLLAAGLLMVGTGLAFAGLSHFWPLLLVAFIGTLNPSSGDVSVFLPLEQARLADAARGDARTTFARYSLSVPCVRRSDRWPPRYRIRWLGRVSSASLSCAACFCSMPGLA
jgi:hypothetical protein